MTLSESTEAPDSMVAHAKACRGKIGGLAWRPPMAVPDRGRLYFLNWAGVLYCDGSRYFLSNLAFSSQDSQR